MIRKSHVYEELLHLLAAKYVICIRVILALKVITKKSFPFIFIFPFIIFNYPPKAISLEFSSVRCLYTYNKQR